MFTQCWESNEETNVLWISVSERLPRESGVYFVRTVLLRRRAVFLYSPALVAKYDVQQGWYLYDRFYRNAVVGYWTEYNPLLHEEFTINERLRNRIESFVGKY